MFYRWSDEIRDYGRQGSLRQLESQRCKWSHDTFCSRSTLTGTPDLLYLDPFWSLIWNGRAYPACHVSQHLSPSSLHSYPTSSPCDIVGGDVTKLRRMDATVVSSLLKILYGSPGSSHSLPARLLRGHWDRRRHRLLLPDYRVREQLQLLPHSGLLYHCRNHLVLCFHSEREHKHRRSRSRGYREGGKARPRELHSPTLLGFHEFRKVRLGRLPHHLQQPQVPM